MAYTYGWGDRDIENMPYRSLMQYWLAINVIESEQQLMAIEAACAPMLDKSKRKEMIRGYRTKIRSGVNKSDGKTATIQDVAKAFARMQANG